MGNRHRISNTPPFATIAASLQIAKNRKNMPLQKKVVPLPPKTSIIYSLKIENYARNFE
jgi:hypothetical protein